MELALLSQELLQQVQLTLSHLMRFYVDFNKIKHRQVFYCLIMGLDFGLPANAFEWKLPYTFKRADVGTELISEEYIIDNVTWRLYCYPNGKTAQNQNKFGLFLKCCDLGDRKEYQVDVVFCCKEWEKQGNSSHFFYAPTHEKQGKTVTELIAYQGDDGERQNTMKQTVFDVPQTISHTFTQEDNEIGCSDVCSTDELLFLKTMTIQCYIVPKTMEISMDATTVQDYIPKSIVPPSVSDEKEPDYKDDEETSPFKQDTLLCSKHMVIMREWNEDTDRLKSLQSVGTASTDDDEKGNIGSSRMIETFFETQSFLKTQTERINMVMTDEYLVEVMNRQHALSVNGSFASYSV